MKKTLSVAAVLLLVAAIGASVWWRQREKERSAQEQSAALQSQVQALASELEEREARKPSSPAVTNAIVVTAQPPSENTAPPAGKTPMNPAMLQDPETRALMQKQMEQGLARMADKLISKEFAGDWKLSPDQVRDVKDFVREKASAGKSMLQAMMFDGLDDQALAQRGRETKQRIENADAALRGILGDDGFNALKERERLMEDSDRAKRIREELAAAEQPLTKPQHDALIEAMGAERQAFTFRVDYSDPLKVDFEHIRDFFSEANLQIHFADMQQLNARIVERAALFLSPEQLAQLKAAQQSQLEQARLTVKMTTELFNKRRAN